LAVLKDQSASGRVEGPPRVAGDEPATPPAAPTSFDEVKLLLVGPGDVGKSWLLDALQGNKPEPRESTKGIEIARVSVNISHPTDSARTFQFNCWDFGGQDRYQITHQIFFSPKAVYLLVWKPRKDASESGLERRLERIRISAGDTAKVLIVSTHASADVLAEPPIELLKERFGNLIWGFFAVDSKEGKDGMGIATLKEEIAKAAAQLDGIDLPYGHHWKLAQKSLNNRDEPVIKLDDLVRICQGFGLDPIEARTLAIVMDFQGHLVYFDDADQSATVPAKDGNNIIILRPEWLAKAVGFVIEDKKTLAASGILEHRHLKKIWAKDATRGCDGYQEEFHRYFLWLMWKFDIAYKQDKSSSLVPEMIHRDRPDDIPWTPASPNHGDRQATIICRVKGKQPPPGFVPVLTAAVHSLRRARGPHSPKDRLDRNWNNGFFLDTESRGMAFAELVDREFRFTVRHGYPADLARQLRKTLAAVIQERWEKLGHDFVVPCLTISDRTPCAGRFIYSWLMERERTTVPCQECGSDSMKVDDLLEGLDVRGEEAVRMLRDLSARQDRLLAVAMRLYRDMLDPDRQEVIRAPCMLTITPEESNWAELIKSATQCNFRVQCWCEHPDGPHRDIPANGRKTVEHVIKGSKDWVACIAPYLSWMSGLIKGVVPRVGGAIDHGVRAVFGNETVTNVDAMDQFAKSSSTVVMSTLSFVKERVKLRSGTRPEIAALSNIHDLMLEQWPDGKRWGGLRPVLTKTGQLLWLCKEHADVQTPPVLESLE